MAAARLGHDAGTHMLTPDEGAAGSGPALEVVALGGLGEFGLNMLAVSFGDTTILVDAGAMFPGPELPGVDLIVPDLSYLQGRHVRALVLTHAHEDHIGGVPYVLPYVDGPVYATPLTLAMLGRKLEEHEIDLAERAVPVRPRDRVTVGPITIEFIRVTHSIPDCVALVLHTPVGVLVHTGDFKVDQTPLDGEHFDFHRLAELGTQGVLALLADSTNVDRRGHTGSELEVVDAFEEIFTSAPGRLVVTTFASSLYRLQILTRLAVQFGRKVAFVGRGMIENSQIAQQLGYLDVPPGVVVRDSDVPTLPPREVLCIATGSQGEPMAALSRIAIDDHRFVKIATGDTVVFSARAIPGNEKAIGRVMNHVTRRGADVITEQMKHVHVSGHGSEEELKLVLSLVRPRTSSRCTASSANLRTTAGWRSASPATPVRPWSTPGRKRRRAALHLRRGFDCRQGVHRPGVHRRHARRRGGRRSAPGPAPSRRGRPCAPRARHQQAGRLPRRIPGDRSPAAS